MENRSHLFISPEVMDLIVLNRPEIKPTYRLECQIAYNNEMTDYLENLADHYLSNNSRHIIIKEGKFTEETKEDIIYRFDLTKNIDKFFSVLAKRFFHCINRNPDSKQQYYKNQDSEYRDGYFIFNINPSENSSIYIVTLDNILN